MKRKPKKGILKGEERALLLRLFRDEPRLGQSLATRHGGPEWLPVSFDDYHSDATISLALKGQVLKAMEHDQRYLRLTSVGRKRIKSAKIDALVRLGWGS